ncbi:hypothetical protein HDU77_000274 [Chytriomyces hyalinus]|nr:hypothetical protein HDU77_000274 [Chytriomyces hyalinus]
MPLLLGAKVEPLLDPSHEALVEANPQLQMGLDFTPADPPVFIIPFTGELFATYDDFYARMTFYRRPKFTCEVTGKANLSYEAALKSELTARERAQNRFPEYWRKSSLEFIHFNRCQIQGLVDNLSDHLKGRLFVNEIVQSKGSFVKVMDVIGPNGSMLDLAAAHSPKPAEPPSTPPQPIAYTAPSFNDIPPSQLKYVVHVCDELGELYLDEGCDLDQTIANGHLRFQIRASESKRPRSVLNKANIRWFINESADRGAGVFSPWIVKDALVKKYGLPTEPPVIKRLRVKTTPGKTASKFKYPMEDLELLEVAPRELQPAPPVLSRDFGRVPIECTPILMQMWNFFTIFGKPLRLHPFTLDDFIHALGAPKCNLHQEAMAALINSACLARMQTLQAAHTAGSNKLQGAALTSVITAAAAAASALASSTPAHSAVTANTSTAPDADTPSIEPHDLTSTATTNATNSFSNPSKLETHHNNTTAATPATANGTAPLSATNAASSQFHSLYMSKFAELTEFEQMAVDQWFKWSPGKWADPVKDVVRSSQTPQSNWRNSTSSTSAGAAKSSKAAIQYTVTGRLRAWEVALVGFVRDCVTEVEFANKWKVLATLVGAVPISEEEEEHGNELAEQTKEDDMAVEQDDGGEEEEDGTSTLNGGSLKRELSVDVPEDTADPSPVAETAVPSTDQAAPAAKDEEPGSRGRRKRRKVDSYYANGTEEALAEVDDEKDDSFVAEDPVSAPSSGFRRTTRKQWHEDTNSTTLASATTTAAPTRSSGRSTRAALAATQSALTQAQLESLTEQQPGSPSLLSPNEKDKPAKDEDGDEDEEMADGEEADTHHQPATSTPAPAAATTTTTTTTKKSHKFNPFKTPRPVKEKVVEAEGIHQMAHLLDSTSRGFTALPVADRLALIKIMAEQWAAQTTPLRTFMDACHEKVAEVKRYKRENFGKEQRAVAVARYELSEKLQAKADEEAAALSKEEAPSEDEVDEKLAAGVDADDTAENGDAESNAHNEDSTAAMGAGDDDSDDDDDAVHLSASALRMRRVRKDLAKKKEKERIQREENARLKLEKKEKDREMKALAEEKKRVEDLEQAFYQKQLDFEAENLIASAVSRMTPLGSDRNYNKYWWFDNYCGLIPKRVMPCEVNFWNVSPFASSGFATGVLLVEEIGGSSVEGIDAPPVHDVTVLEQGLVAGTRWGYLSTPQEVDVLVQWLDSRGIREQALIDHVKKARELMEVAMANRLEMLSRNACKVVEAGQQQQQQLTRRRGRKQQQGGDDDEADLGHLPSYLAYKNVYAKM